MKIVALVSAQGTACAETALYDAENTPDARKRIEAQFCTGEPDAPLAGSWCDVSDNDALNGGKSMAWIIVNTADDSLAWSNDIGWTDDQFDTFTDAERETLNLPIGGEWRQVPWKAED